MDVGVGFFDFVEQDHRVWLAPHGLGQHAAFAIADIARRRTLERGDGMRFLVFAHVDGDQVLLTAVQGFGQSECGFGLAHAGGAGQQEHADRFIRVIQAGAAGLDALGDHLHRVVLADHALGQQFGQA
ncbi:hypothetical protein XAUB_12560 [Xanthomonas citri pv. aurantifolii str. ICPB 11122]|nr:hypothetical protein XAUB_12560 [Xanthomonas citri pv. aurantifolii str. ICPB 11122]